MKFSPIFMRFAKEIPISVMARGLMERAFNAEQMDQWFNRHADSQYTRNLLFSTIFDIISLVSHLINSVPKNGKMIIEVIS
jgi:hypothetical protein